MGGMAESLERGYMTGELEAPHSFKPSRLVGEKVTVTQNDRVEEFSIVAAYTYKKWPWGKKTIRFRAEAL
jgi:hypothetical protein